MNTHITSWVDLTLHQAQRCQHLAWFIYGWLEREHVLNVDAFVASWVREVAWPSNRWLFPTVQARGNPGTLSTSSNG